MSKFRLTIPLAAAVCASLGITGCADESPWGSSASEKGSLDVYLSTDLSFDTAKPQFRSGEEEETQDKPKLADYTTKIPGINDFSVKLEKQDGTLMQDWSSYEDFKSYTSSTDIPAGLYTITAYYGDMKTPGLNSPYFEAKSTFTVLAGRPTTVNLKAELKNSMVVVNYTDKFKNYMSEYSSSLRIDGLDNKISMVEGKAVFVKPEADTDVTVDFTTKDTKKISNLNTGTFAPLAKTLHNITFDVEENNNGATLNITFDESLEGTKEISINLTDDLYTTPCPEITCTGFTNGETINTLGDAANSASAIINVMAQGGIKNANLSIAGPDSYTQSWGTQTSNGQYTIDLANTSNLPTEISAQGFMSSTEAKPAMATLNLTNFIRNLPQNGEYTISLVVKDHNNKDSEAVTFKVNSMAVVAERVEPTDSSETEATYGSNIVTTKLSYNGADPKEVIFKDKDGNEVEVQKIEYNGVTVFTRAFESKVYDYTLKLPSNVLSSQITLNAFKGSEKIATISGIPVKLPKYKISEVDAFAKHALLKVSTTDPKDLAIVMENIKFKDIDKSKISQNNKTGIITITKLSSSTKYNIESSITNDNSWQTKNAFTTETESSIPNGNFSQTSETINHQKVNVGGKYSYTKSYQATANIVRREADNWASINAKTCWWDAPGAKNTWFQVPSTYVENGQVVIRNVAYDHNGTQPEPMPSGFAKTYWYNTNVPTFTTFASGELFLGSYSFDGVEHRSDGIDFSSRPSSIDFDYTYSPVGNDKASVDIIVRNSSGTEIGSTKTILNGETNLTRFSVKISSYKFGEKAAKIEICFRSSTSQNPKEYVIIPKGSDLDEGFGALNFGDLNLGDNNYHAVATGSVLTIDNVSVGYDY